MEIKALDRSRGDTAPRRDTSPVERAAIAQLASNPVPANLDADVASARLLRDAVREAGLFQRSVLGHLDHKEWRDRVRMDGQRLVDLLAEIGFRPSERPLRKSA